MTPQHVVDLSQQAVQMILLLSAPALLASMVIGLAVSLFQAVTSMQEATLTFVPKLVAVFVALLISLPWMMHLAVRFAVALFGSLGQFAR